MKLLKTILILCLFTTVANAQFVTNSKRAADVYFQNKEYYAAAEYYKKALQITADSAGFVVPYGFENRIKQESPKKDDYEYSVFQLAESLRLYKNFKDAESWYAIAKGFSNPKYILSGFWYGETLRANQKYSEAISAFEEFLSKYKTNDGYLAKGKSEIASCQFALYELRYPRLFDVDKLKNGINDKGSNYAGTIQKDVFYFTSSRPVSASSKREVLTDNENAKVSKPETPYLNAIYEASGDPLTQSVTIKKLVTSDGKNKESAAAAFHPNGKAVYITGWTANGDKKIYQLVATPGTGKTWSEPIELAGQVNVKGFNSIQPFVTKDGKFLIFSSNKPGGSGKYDLWYAPLRADGSLGQAVNFGPGINTTEDEQAPYYNTDSKKLLFSANGRVGMGGYDFFESTGDLSSLSEPRNLGFPFNSSKDDLYFTPSADGDAEGYISSDRESLCCLEVFHVKRSYLTVKGIVLDCKTSKPLADATITLVDSSETLTTTTDASGAYIFKVNSNRKLKITAEKASYFSKVLNFTYEDIAGKDTLFSPEICLLPYDDKPIVLKDVLYEFNKATLTEDSKGKLDYLYTILVDNPTINIELSAHTDSKGTDAYNLDLSDRRAKSCVDYLISKGISTSRMRARGYGESQPVAPNQLANGKDNPDGRALNRRTEFKVIKK